MSDYSKTTNRKPNEIYNEMDCLIVSYSEQDRNRERHQFYNKNSSSGTGWERFLHLSYVDYDNDIILPNQLASLVEVESENGKI